ncbi:MAG: hypothetical protein RLZZ206_3826 [Cyanobacteriota bacterium]
MPAPPGKAITSTEALNAGEVWDWASTRAWAPACGVGSLCPDLIHQPLRGSLWLQLPDRQWVPCCCVNGLTVKHQRVARVLTVVREDQSVAHERVLLSPFLSRDDAATVNPAMVLLSLAADQLSAPTSTGSAVSQCPLARVSTWSRGDLELPIPSIHHRP